MDRRRPVPDPFDEDLDLVRAWRDHRRHVLDIGFRMLGGLAEAEDAVQEAFARLMRADLDDIDDVRGWLVVVVSRLCLDRLRSGRRHPTSPDAALGERPADRAVDPGDRVTLDDSVGLALHRVLERLSAAERTAFVLHDVFQYPFDAIAEIVGRTPAACRQLASRARRTIREEGGPGRFAVEPAEQRRFTERFLAACATGDIGALLPLLDPDVDGVAQVGGAIGERVTTGRDQVVTMLLAFFGPDSATTLLSLPTGRGAGFLALRDGRPRALVVFTVRDGRVSHLDAIADPVRLARLGAVLGT